MWRRVSELFREFVLNQEVISPDAKDIRTAEQIEADRAVFDFINRNTSPEGKKKCEAR